MRRTWIQIVEDDRALSDGIRLTLRETELEFTQSFCIRQAKTDFLQREADIVILDVNLPDGSGYEYLRWLKERSDALVLILTANDLETDEVTGLTLGADDYMAKPFSLAVLRARIQLFIKRISDNERGEDNGRFTAKAANGAAVGEKEKTGRAPNEKQSAYEEDAFSFHFDRLEFFQNGREIALSVNEQKLLRLFVENRGRVLTRDLLAERLWGDGGIYVDENALSVTVNRLRGKLEEKKSGVSYIQTVYGQGYMWKKKKRERGKAHV